MNIRSVVLLVGIGIAAYAAYTFFVKKKREMPKVAPMPTGTAAPGIVAPSPPAPGTVVGLPEERWRRAGEPETESVLPPPTIVLPDIKKTAAAMSQDVLVGAPTHQTKQAVADYLNRNYGDLMKTLNIGQLELKYGYGLLRAWQELALDRLGVGADKWEQIYGAGKDRPLSVINYFSPLRYGGSKEVFYTSVFAPEIIPYYQKLDQKQWQDVPQAVQAEARWKYPNDPARQQHYVKFYTNVLQTFGKSNTVYDVVGIGPTPSKSGVALFRDPVLGSRVCVGGGAQSRAIQLRLESIRLETQKLQCMGRRGQKEVPRGVSREVP